MSNNSPGTTRIITFLPEALADLRDLEDRFPTIAAEVLSQLKRVRQGTLRPTRLRDFSKTGNLSDCAKVNVLVDGAPEHRIVLRDVGDGRFVVVEVVAIDERADDLVYLLAGVRLGRIVDPIRRSDIERRVARVIAGRLNRNR